MKAALLALCLGALMVAASAAERAQDASVLDVSKCLAPPSGERGQPEYPKEATREGDQGSVTVELTFTDPGAPPGLKVLVSSGVAALDASVARYVSRLRAPCMRAGQPAVRMRQQFVFQLDGPYDTMAATRLDSLLQDDGQAIRCISRVDGSTRPRPAEDRVQGTVLAEVLFTAADKEPEVSIVSPAASEALNESVKAFMRGYRLACLNASRARGEQLFRFHGTSRPARLEMNLSEFLHLVRKDGMGSAAFDTNAMSCPFKAVVEYWEPLRRNRVNEVGDAVPSRRQFLEWLASLRVNAYPDIESLMQADRITISVPCGKIDP